MAYVQEVEQKAELQSAVNITTPCADDAVHLVAQAIVTDAEDFFKLGAAENLEDLTFLEFTQACEKIVPGFSQGEVQNMFTRLDTNKNDKVSQGLGGSRHSSSQHSATYEKGNNRKFRLG